MANLKITKNDRVPFKQAQPITRDFDGETGVLIATGPSLTDKQLDIVRESQVKVFTINNVYQRFPTSDVHLSCDHPWWCHYYPNDEKLRTLKARKYTWHPTIADEYGLNYIRAIEKEGLSRDPTVIHINHGSGPMSVNLAAFYGIKRLILIGHDMKFAKDYDGRKNKVGSTPRHYFGEYPEHLQHFPSVKIGLSQPGVIDGLIERYEKMSDDLDYFGMEVVNCTPGSALHTFRESTLEEEL